MSQTQQSTVYSAEIFNIIPENLPDLYAYHIITRGSDQQVRIGRKLADRLMRSFAGHWVWSDDVIVTDTLQKPVALEQKIQEIRVQEKDVFKDLSGVELIADWKALAGVQAEFVAQGLFSEINRELLAALQPPIKLGERATVEREVDVRGWVVKGEPVISLSIESRVIFRDDLKTYFAQLKSPDALIGMYVVDKVRYENGSAMKGEIFGVEGQLDIDVSRQELLDITQREESRLIIQQAEKGEYVVRVGHNEYRYVLSALKIIVFNKHYRRYGIDTKAAQRATWITPSERLSLVNKVADIARSHRLIGHALSSQQSSLFSFPPGYRYDPTILLGTKSGENGRVAYKGGTNLLNAINRHGLYQPISTVGSVDVPLNVGIINASRLPLDSAWKALQEQLKLLGFVRTQKFEEKISEVSRIDFERAMRKLQSAEPHILLAIIPDSDSMDEDEWGPYYDFKSLAMDIQIPSQVIDQNTLKNEKRLPYVMQNVAFGMSSKMGNVPYILANTLEYADIVVGIDIAHKRNKSGVGTQNAAAIAQVYQKGGQFAQCRVIETPLEGETVPGKILRSLFPLTEFEGKRVIIHRDGLFRGNEIEIIQDHLAKLNSTAYFVEVIKSGAPRLYAVEQGQVRSPEIGTAFRLSDTEAFLIASESSTATPQPLHVRTREPFTIGKALHSVLMLTLMHYGSIKRPRLPVTIHYSDRIGYLALRGVKPVGGYSTDMYWL